MLNKNKMKKTTWVKQFIDDEGFTVITGDCEICNQWPCKHVSLGFDGVKINPLPKLKRNKEKARRKQIREKTKNKTLKEKIKEILDRQIVGDLRYPGDIEHLANQILQAVNEDKKEVFNCFHKKGWEEYKGNRFCKECGDVETGELCGSFGCIRFASPKGKICIG